MAVNCRATPPGAPAPGPFGPIASARQLRWHALEYYGFLHFTVNTFTDQEWGFGDETPSVFAPTDFDAGQIADVAAKGGMAGLILTCKHHDGFCLWPSRYTEHSVRHSPWRDGRGDDGARERGEDDPHRWAVRRNERSHGWLLHPRLP